MDRLHGLRSGALSWRRFGVLVRHLPREAALNRARYGEVVRWGAVEHLLADLRDLLMVANWQRSGDAKIPRPEPIPRPGAALTEKQQRRSQLTQQEINERLLAQNERRRGRGMVNGDRACDRVRQPGSLS
jgi:hypothetical protein